jgi:hypothetical protein
MGGESFRRAAGRLFASRPRVALVTAICTIMVTGGVAVASIPGGDGVIHACYGKKGVLKVIDADAKSCPHGTTELTWNQTGVPGPAGSPGPPGQKGDPGDSTVAGLTIVTAGDAAGQVADAGGIDCQAGLPGSDCTEVYPVGTVVTLTAHPGTFDTTVSWDGPCEGSAGTCAFTIQQTTTVTVTFTGPPPPPPQPGPLAITEVMPNPSAGDGQWIEVTNWGPLPIDLFQTTIITQNGGCSVFESVVVPGDGVVVIGQPGVSYPFPVASTCDFSIPLLPAQPDALHLIDSFGNTFGLDLASMQVPADGHPLQLSAEIAGTHDFQHYQEAQMSTAWCPASGTGSPGTQNGEMC